MKIILLLAVALMTVFPQMAQASDSPYDDLRKDLRILRTVLSTAFDVEEDHFFSHRNNRNGELVPEDIDFTYLRGQGVLILIDLGTGDFPLADFGRFRLSGLSDMSFGIPNIRLPNSLIYFDTNDEEEQEEQSQMIREMLEEAFETSREASDMLREAMEEAADSFQMDFSDEHRDKIARIQTEYRDALKKARDEARDLQREYTNKNNMSEDDKQAAETRIRAYQDQIREMMKQNVEKIEEIRVENEKVWNSKLSEFETNLIETLCEYGAPRALPADEHVTLLLRQAQITSEGTRDRIYVFTKSDLEACRAGSMTTQELLDKGKAYAF